MQFIKVKCKLFKLKEFQGLLIGDWNCESCVKVLKVIVNWTFRILIFIKCIYLRLFHLNFFISISSFSKLKHKRHFSWDQQASKKANSQSIDRKINGKSSTNNRFNTIALKTVKNVNKNSISNSILQMVSWCCYGCCCCKQQLFNWIQMFKKEIGKFIN